MQAGPASADAEQKGPGFSYHRLQRPGEPQGLGVEDADVEHESRRHFLRGAGMWATLGDHEPKGLGLGGCSVYR